MKKRLVKVVAYTFFIGIFLLVVVLGAEIFLRFVPAYNQEWLDYNTNTIWRMKANNYVKNWTQDIGNFDQTSNRDGFNDVNHNEMKKVGVKRIMVIGDSYTAGVNYPIEKTFTGVLQLKLNEKFPGKYEVMNCAVPAWDMEQEFLYYVKEGRKYEPDYVLLVAVPNDIRESFIRGLVDMHGDTTETWLVNPMTKKEKLLWKLSAHSSLAIWLQKKNIITVVNAKEMFWKYFGRSFPDFPSDSAWDEPLFLKQTPWQVESANKRYTALLAALNTRCKEQNAKLFVTIIPTKEEFDNTLSDTSKYQPGKVAFWLDSTCAAMHLPYFNAYHSFVRFEHPLDLFQSWEFHFAKEGHQFMGEKVFDFLTSEMEEKK